ncbi:hypothetical protein K503DRAFT_427307 [Rhizopogon vinicolor AM-OR11-026]|uniref:Secreted protein n=1 Tax=Rhizopogon vinicolor AM-OR11-026 TaxID=1314800 RepID=A0A1B7NAR1_9AGAM|nr:hypothetical protein K503DRAFT_427307 [Rhizopogon vinicolor AM-OR11-026]
MCYMYLDRSSFCFILTMLVYVEGKSVSFSQNLSVECSYVSPTLLRRPGIFGRTARFTLTVCDVFDSLTTEFPFVVQPGLHHNIKVSLPLSELVVGDGAAHGDSNGSRSVSVSSGASAGSSMGVGATQLCVSSFIFRGTSMSYVCGGPQQ